MTSAIVERWLDTFSVTTRQGCKSGIGMFETWLRGKGGFASLEDAVRFQKSAVGDDRYRIVDLLTDWLKNCGGAYKGLTWRNSIVRSFFRESRAELPVVRLNLTPTRDMAVGRLGLDVFQTLLKSADLRDQAIYLTCFQGLFDQYRFFQYFNPKGYELGEYIKTTGTKEPYRIEVLRGRKSNRNSYNTWIGHDALEAWKLYFDRKRGWPQEGESAALDRYGKPLTQHGFFRSHSRRLRNLHYINGYGTHASRYGYNPHELRDLARSILEKARSKDFNTNSVEYWMGHTVDPQFYNKIWKLDADYNLNQYRIAEKYLNILSGTISQFAARDELKQMLFNDPNTRQDLKTMILEMDELKTMMNEALEKRLAQKIIPIPKHPRST